MVIRCELSVKICPYFWIKTYHRSLSINHEIPQYCAFKVPSVCVRGLCELRGECTKCECEVHQKEISVNSSSASVGLLQVMSDPEL